MKGSISFATAVGSAKTFRSVILRIFRAKSSQQASVVSKGALSDFFPGIERDYLFHDRTYSGIYFGIDPIV